LLVEFEMQRKTSNVLSPKGMIMKKMDIKQKHLRTQRTNNRMSILMTTVPMMVSQTMKATPTSPSMH
jgi:hypothetical protein